MKARLFFKIIIIIQAENGLNNFLKFTALKNSLDKVLILKFKRFPIHFKLAFMV